MRKKLRKINLWINVCVCVCVCERERERDRERDLEFDKYFKNRSCHLVSDSA